MKQICPMFSSSHKWNECLKEECAWWYGENHCCAVLTLAQGSIYIHRVALEIANKMSHEEQFRK